MKDNIKDMARQMARMSTSDLSELSTALMENGISATIYRFSPIKSIWDEDRVCSIFMEKTGSKKLLLVKTIKELLGLGLRDSKHIVDTVPCYIIEFTDVPNGKKIAEELIDCGATVRIEYHD